MAKDQKKLIRKLFRDACFKRDKYSCVMCGLKAKSLDDALKIFDVHHICDRSLMVAGGYVLENGITLCHEDHFKAEQYWSTGTAYPGYSQEDLYIKINSSLEKAIEACEKIK